LIGLRKRLGSGNDCYSNNDCIFTESDFSGYRETYSSLERYKQQEQLNRKQRVFERARLRRQQTNDNYKQFKAQQNAKEAGIDLQKKENKPIQSL
jgi:hypothetical protein